MNFLFSSFQCIRFYILFISPTNYISKHHRVKITLYLLWSLRQLLKWAIRIKKRCRHQSEREIELQMCPGGLYEPKQHSFLSFPFHLADSSAKNPQIKECNPQRDLNQNHIRNSNETDK